MLKVGNLFPQAGIIKQLNDEVFQKSNLLLVYVNKIKGPSVVLYSLK